MVGFNDFYAAIQAKATIISFIQEEMARLRPEPKVATVMAIDHKAKRVMVQYIAETSIVSVKMNTIRPSEVGQLVRIDGPAKDRYITDVIGSLASLVMSASSSATPSIGAPGSDYAPFSVYQVSATTNGWPVSGLVITLRLSDYRMVQYNVASLGTSNHRTLKRTWYGAPATWSGFRDVEPYNDTVTCSITSGNGLTGTVQAIMIQPQGIVYLTGSLTGNSLPAVGTQILTIPSSHAPRGALKATVGGSAASNSAERLIGVASSGAVYYLGGTTGTGIWFDGVSYPTIT